MSSIACSIRYLFRKAGFKENTGKRMKKNIVTDYLFY